MAYATQFYYTYYEAVAEGLNLSPWQFRISLNRKDYTGEAIEVLPGSEPLTVEAVDSPDNRLASVWPLKFTLELACQEFWQAESLYVSDEREVQLILEIDKGAGFQVEHFGWLTPVDFKMDHASKPFRVSVTATDGLASLKKRPITDSAGKRLQGYVRVSQVLRSALAVTGYNRPLTTGINLFELNDVSLHQIGGKVAVDLDPLYQTFLRSETLILDDGTTQAGFEAIKRICDVFELRLAQCQGQWVAVRANEVVGGWDVWAGIDSATLRTRAYESDSAESSALINQSENLITNVGPGHSALILAGGPVDILPIPKKGVKIEQAFGRKISRLPNADFSEVDSTFLPVGWRRNNTSAQAAFRAGNGTETDLYRLVLYGATDEKINDESPYIGTRVYYQEVDPEFTKEQVYTLSGEFQLHNLRASKIVVGAFVKAGKDLQFWLLQANGSWKVNPTRKEQVAILTYHYQTVNGVQQSKPGWASFNFKTEPISNILSLVVYLCVGEALDAPGGGPNLGPPEPYIEYRNIRWESAESEQNLDGTSQIVNLPNQKAPDVTLSLTLGDTPYLAGLYNRVNTLYRDVSGGSYAPASTWYYPDADPSLDEPTGRNVGKKLLAWLTDDYAKQMMQLAPTFEGQIIGRLSKGIHSVLRLTDFGEEIGGVFTPYLLQLTRWKWRTRMSTHEVTAVRIRTDSIGSLPAPKAYWQTADGEVPVNVDDEGKPVNPADGQIKLSPKDQVIASLLDAGVLTPTAGARASVNGFVPLTDKPRAGAIVYNGNDVIGKIQAAFTKLNLKPFQK